MGLLVFGLIILILIIFIKYKPVYKVVLDGEEIGTIEDEREIENAIESYLNKKDEQIAFVTLKV